MLILLLGTKVSEDESSGTFVLGNESSWVREFHESFIVSICGTTGNGDPKTKKKSRK